MYRGASRSSSHSGFEEIPVQRLYGDSATTIVSPFHLEEFGSYILNDDNNVCYDDDATLYNDALEEPTFQMQFYKPRNDFENDGIPDRHMETRPVDGMGTLNGR